MSVDLIDTHCHLDLESLAGDAEAVLERARQAGVRQCLTVGTSVTSSRANVMLAHRFPQLAAAVGIHPNDAQEATDAALAEIDALAADPRVAAIGEVGLDFYRDETAPDIQQRTLRGFLAIAKRRDLPLAIHCRNAYEPLLDLLREHRHGTLRGLIHCASGPREFIQGALHLGFFISFAGNVTFPNAKALRELVLLVPDDRLLIETDAPFLAPQPVRGQKNEPAFVAHTAAHLARLRGMTPEALGALTSRNARRLFGLPDPSPSA